jgi:hypothetical protein
VAVASRRTDMYAFAVTAWEILACKVQFTCARSAWLTFTPPSSPVSLLCQKRPFDTAKNQHKLEREVLSGTRPDLNDLPHNTSKNMRQLITDCWAKDRTLRWTAQQCFAALNKEYDSVATTEFDIFFSHRWASKPFLSHVYMLLCEKGYKVQCLSALILSVHYLAVPLTSILFLQVWYDVNEMGHDLKESMEKGIQNSEVGFLEPFLMLFLQKD